MKKPPRASTRRKWQLLHEEFKSCNQTEREFCVERKINIYLFRGWQERFRKEHVEVAKQGARPVSLFREVTPQAAQGSYSMTLRSGRSLAVESGFVESELRKLIEILESC